jgi:signal transduction histidine kinase
MKLNNISISIKLAAIILIALVTAIFLVILEIEPEINITHNDFLMVSTDICNNITHAAQETGELSEDLINQYISDMKYALNIRIVDTNWTVLFDSTSHNKNSEQALDINDITNMLNTRKPYSAVLPIRVENKTLGYLLTELQASELQISQPLYNTLLPLRIIIAIVVFFLLVYLATSSIRRRFNALLQTIQRFASGDLSVSASLNVQPEDELGELNAVLNDMAQKLTDARNKELKMEEAKNELIAGVSHDLKNPLTSILGYTQILKESGPEALNNSAHYLDIIESKALQLKTMVEELFTYTKLNTGDIPLKRSRLNLVDLVRQIASEFETYFSQTGKTLTLILPKNPVFAEIDGDLISRAIDNLLMNANKHAHQATKIDIKLTVNEQKHDNNAYNKPMAVISVSDNGIGIPPDEIDLIFQRFYKGYQSSDNNSSGLGLAICQRIAHLHGGDIWVSSEPGIKTEFAFSLPL